MNTSTSIIDAPGPAIDGRWRALAALASGALVAASFPPFDWGFLVWIALAPLLWALDGATWRQAAARGWLAGVVAMAGIGYFATAFGGGIRWMQALPWVLFAGIEALFFALVSIAIAGALRGRSAARILAGVPAAWVLGEWLRGAGPFGFPFGFLGYALHSQPAAFQIAAFGGVYLVSAVVALASSGLYVLVVCGRGARRIAFSALAIPVVSALYGALVLNADAQRADFAAPTADVVVVQAAQGHPWRMTDERAAYDALARSTLDAVARAQTRPALVVWSESSVPGFLLDEPDLLAVARRVARTAHSPLLTGTIRRDEAGRLANSAVLLAEDGAIEGIYAKRMLVPFGEWTPLRGVLPFLDDFGAAEEDQEPGSGWTVLTAGRLRLGVPICFESASPAISRAFARRGANLLVIITNDSWFFRTGMAEQHAYVAQMRAVETGRWVVQCGLTGISGFISPRGEWHSSLPLDQAGSLTDTVRLRTEMTLFTRYGHWFLALSVAALFWAVLPQLPRPVNG